MSDPKLSVIEAIFYNDMHVGSHDEAPRGYLTRADESGIEYYIKLDKERYEGRLYVIHPDDLAAVRAYHPKQIPIQMEGKICQ